MIVDNELPGEAALPLSPPAPCSPDSLTEVTARNLFTGHEVPLVISHKEAFDGYLDTVIGELLVCMCVGGFHSHLEMSLPCSGVVDAIMM